MAEELERARLRDGVMNQDHGLSLERVLTRVSAHADEADLEEPSLALGEPMTEEVR